MNSFEEKLEKELNEWSHPDDMSNKEKAKVWATWGRDQAKQDLGWQDIATAPKDGRTVLCMGEESDSLYLCEWSKEHGFYLKGWGPIKTTTHWLPIPELGQPY